MTDYAPLPLREPVRSLVWIQGRLRTVSDAEVPALLDLIAATDPNPALLQVNPGSADEHRYAMMRLEVESVVVADSTGAESVPLSVSSSWRGARHECGERWSPPHVRCTSSVRS